MSAGKFTEAVKVAATASPIVAQTHDRGAHLAFAIVNARVAAATGDSAKAAESLNRTISEATRLSYTVYAFEARLALGETEIRTGHADAGGRRLAVLEKEAANAGFALMARKAAARRA